MTTMMSDMTLRRSITNNIIVNAKVEEGEWLPVHTSLEVPVGQK